MKPSPQLAGSREDGTAGSFPDGRVGASGSHRVVTRKGGHAHGGGP